MLWGRRFVVGLEASVYIRENVPVTGGLKEAVEFGRPHPPGNYGTKPVKKHGF